MIEHKNMTSYHPQANNIVESFKKTFHKGLTKICELNKDNWDDKVLEVLWEYRTTYKRLTGKTLFKLLYGQEVVILLKHQALMVQHTYPRFIQSRGRPTSRYIWSGDRPTYSTNRSSSQRSFRSNSQPIVKDISVVDQPTQQYTMSWMCRHSGQGSLSR
jgi:hypothetical protein